ncbi:MAG: ABC transporter ATP-binding protein, partial [Myxococcota bacterium]
TTLRMIVGLIRPSAGQVSIVGEHLTFWDRRALRKVGAIIEAPALYGYLSGRDNLRMLASLTGPCPARRIDEVLDRVGMLGRADDKTRVYSHGMKQRLAIAAALLPGPDLVLLDEPTNGLDPMGIRDTRELVRSLARDDGYTIFLSSHLLVEVEQICNRGAILVEGRKLWEGQVADLLQRRRRIRLRAQPVEVARGALERLAESRPPADSDDGDGTRFELTQPDPGDPALLYALGGAHGPEDMVEALVGAGCRVSEVRVEVPSLEEVFVELVGAGEAA